MFNKVGSLPASLLDHPDFMEWVNDVSAGLYYPPDSRFVSADAPVIDCLMDMVIEAHVAMVAKGFDYYKGIPFLHGSFDAWTSNIGYPFVGVNFSFLTPWRMSRLAPSKPFTGEKRAMLTLELIHLTGSHSGE